MIHIFVFFSEFIRNFKISKNWNVQALGDSTFGDGAMMKDLTMCFKKAFSCFLDAQKRSKMSYLEGPKNTKNSFLKPIVRSFIIVPSPKVESPNAWTFEFFEILKSRMNSLKKTKMCIISLNFVFTTSSEWLFS